MNLEKIRAFVTVAERLNFTQAAEDLGMSQPPLTRLIQGLEEEIGAQLFERTTRQVKLTSAGLYLLQEGRSLIEKAEEVRKQTRAIGNLRSGRLHVGVSQTAFLASLPKVLLEMQSRYPKLKLEVTQDLPSRLLKKVSQGRLDLCLVEGDVSGPGLITRPVQEEVLGLSVPKSHRFAKRKEVAFSDLKNETIILHPVKEARTFFGTIDRLFRSHKIKPKVYTKAPGESCPILVATGRGLSLTVASSPMFKNLGNVFVPLKDSFVPITLVYEEGVQNPSIEIFASFVREISLLRGGRAECLLDVSSES